MKPENLNNPDSWMDHMRRGEFDKAWAISDRDLAAHAGKPCWHLPRHFQYIWDGSSMAGKRVLVRCYHGLGDTIQFIRYASLIKTQAAALIVWAQQELLPLLKTVSGIDELIPLHDGTPEAEYEVDVEIMELSHIFRTTPGTIPAAIPYLFVEPTQLSTTPGKRAVGLVWQAGNWDMRRSLPFSLLAPLFEIDGVEVFILQGNAGSAGWKEGFGIHPGDFSLFEYARVIRGLDLLISVDSMPAHLAGALGVPVWNLLHANADWRWMEKREDSPWYPTMRLFRQEREDDWEGLVEKVASELRQW